MSDVTADDDIEDDEEDAGADGSGGGFLASKRLIILVAAAVLVVGGGGGGAYFAGLLDPLLGIGEVADTPDQVVFFDLPEMVVNLESGSGKPTYLRVQLSLELDEGADLAGLQKFMPRVIDQFQMYLRELRADDLQGSAGIYRLKEELLRRINVAVHPVVVRDVLFKEMLIQ